jgi:HK97 gp10 family phage protein
MSNDLYALEVKGFDTVLDTLKSLPAEVVSKNGGPVRRALAKGARLARDMIKASAPVRTGTLRANVASGKGRTAAGERQVVRILPAVGTYANTRFNRRKRRSGKKYEMGGPAYYWRFLEYGTKKARAQPFILPAVTAGRAQIMETVQADLVRGVDRIVKKLARK